MMAAVSGLRIVSLLASSTEIICALGLEAQLVGRSHECDYPESVKRLPACSEPKFPIDGTSYQIDQRVKAILQEGLSVYRVDAEKLKALRPNIIVTQLQCEVCAVTPAEIEAAVREWVDLQPQIVTVNPNALADVWQDFQNVAKALGVSERGEKLVRTCQQRMQAIGQKAAALSERPSVAFIEWIEPLMSGGNWMPELIALAGGENLFGTAGQHSPYLGWGQLLEADPDVIVVSPCGWGMEKARQEMPLLTTRPLWSDLKAVREHKVFLVDGNQFFNRPGPRLVETLEMLAEMFHPQVFDFGHCGAGWEALYA